MYDRPSAGRTGRCWLHVLVRVVVLSAPALAALLVLPTMSNAQVPPDARWRTIVTEHFRVTFPPGLEALAGHAAERAEIAHARLTDELGHAPRGRVDVVLTDHIDQSNGLATPFPSNRITLYARPPVASLTLSNFHDWIDTLIIHELTHIFHLDRTGGLGRGLRAIFGRVPAPWPFFPAIGTPSWSIEGLATFVESDHTGAGRVHGSYHEMVLRTATLNDAFESIDQIGGTGPTWPGPSRAYIYGSIFAEYVERTHGPEAHRSLIDTAARSWIPAPLAFDRVANNGLGQPFSELYAEWKASLETRFTALADSLRTAGLTESERLPAGGYQAAHPRVAPDGRVAFAAFDAQSAAATRVLEPETGAARTLARRNDLGTVSWMPDGSLVTAQLEYEGPYRIFSDLYRIEPDGAEQRLTVGARLGEPDVAPDGRRVVAIRYEGGTNRLVVHDLETGETRPLTGAHPDVHWALPRWAPDGARIAVGRWERGDYDVVVVDTTGTIQHRITADRALDTGPTWSPDGRYVLFASDRDGISNLYAAELTPSAPSTNASTATSTGEGAGRAPRLHQVTRVLTGAFYPEVSPDARWIYFSRYDVDGFHIERIPYDPAAWHEPAPARTTPARRVAAPPPHERGEFADTLEAQDYSPFPSLLPRYWLPVVTGSAEGAGRFYGAAIGGYDLLRRHAFNLELSIEPSERIAAGRAGYAYAGFGNPTLGIAVSRDWERLSMTSTPEGAPEARMLAREDVLEITSTLTRQRWRSASAVTLGAERVTEHRELFDAPGYRPGVPGPTLAGLFARVGYANYQQHPYSISREDGISIHLAGRTRRDLEPHVLDDGRELDRGYDEVTTQALVYKSIPVTGFARHVLAARLSALLRHGPGARASSIGGATGASVGLHGEPWGKESFLPVRGFPYSAGHGTRAWSLSLEYRAPIALLDRGRRLWPLYLDRLSGAAFLDAGNAWCTGVQIDAGTVCPATRPATLLSAGAEIALDALLFHSMPIRIRAGVATPLQSPSHRTGPSAYLQLGPSF